MSLILAQSAEDIVGHIIDTHQKAVETNIDLIEVLNYLIDLKNVPNFFKSEIIKNLENEISKAPVLNQVNFVFE